MITTSDIQSPGHLDPERRLSWSCRPCRISKGIRKSSRCSIAQSIPSITTWSHLSENDTLRGENLGTTNFVSTMNIEWVVFYVTLPCFWVGNLLNVKSEMRCVSLAEQLYRVVFLPAPPQFQYQKENRLADNHSTGFTGTAVVIIWFAVFFLVLKLGRGS